MTNRILLVDDDSIFRSEFKDCFQEYGIIEASGGEEALRILKRPNEIDLVILDVRMYGMNGIEVLSRIRKISPQVRIVILTAYGSKDVAVEALRAQADDYIEKPLDIDSTREVIEGFLGTKRGESGLDALDLKGKVERVKDFVRRNILKKITLEDAAQSVCLSAKYLSRVFKEQSKEGFNEYKLGLKVLEAKNLLSKTGYTVNQISDKLGYENAESFIRQFKKLTKLTPAAFRHKIQKKKLSPKKNKIHVRCKA
ncbi:MAG TPA: response regulator [Candidatus Margulisiibacteriota bacterium]|nr:response regulator [Candidatus Margulisiibacteriota bacterium]